MICLEPDCGYSIPQGLKQSSTGNLWRHYSLKHPTVSYALKNENRQSSSTSSSPSSFFSPRPSAISKQSGNPSKYKGLLLQFIVSNNLSIRLVESHSFRQLVQFLSPTTISISDSYATPRTTASVLISPRPATTRASFSYREEAGYQ